jgi:hypothetical protein
MLAVATTGMANEIKTTDTIRRKPIMDTSITQSPPSVHWIDPGRGRRGGSLRLGGTITDAERRNALRIGSFTYISTW